MTDEAHRERQRRLALALEDVRKSFGSHVALGGVTFDVSAGEFVAIMGPSGCGKSTLLRIVAGLEEQDSGLIRVNQNYVENLPLSDRRVRLVWQNYALFPHLNVRDNIAFGLTLRRHNKGEVRAKVDSVAALVDISNLLDRRIHELSGGQKQRVAIARALATDPSILLLDEPLSALDAHLRTRVQSELKRLQRRLGISFVYVTHNQSEAFSMADRVIVMNHGKIEQIGTPERVFAAPATRFVAEFVGTNNIIDGTIRQFEQGRMAVETPCGVISVKCNEAEERGVGSHVTIVIQAGKLRRNAVQGVHDNVLNGIVREREFVGSQIVYSVEAASGFVWRMLTQEPFSESEATIGSPLEIRFAAEHAYLLPSSEPVASRDPAQTELAA